MGVGGVQEWQFKGWPYKGGIREILDKLMGVHVLWEDDKVDAKVPAYPRSISRS